jgi:hypothetical protein
VRAEAQVNPPASPFISRHWSLELLRRLDHAGLLPAGSDVARKSIPQEEIAALLATVDTTAGSSYLLRFRQEFKPARRDRWTQAERSYEIGYRYTKGMFAPGIGYDSIAWSGARSIPDDGDLVASLRLAALRAPHIAALLDLRPHHDSELQLILNAGYFGGWLGRRALGYGTGNGGGLVLNAHTFEGFGVFLARPLRIPVLGATRFEMHVSKVDNVLNLNNDQHDIEPWFWTARGSLEPFGHLRIGINRAMMFGGEGNTPVTFERVAKNIIGIYTDNAENNFANQIISVDLRMRIPALPVVAYLDWASDDGAGAAWDVPAVLGGVELVTVSATRDFAIGVEHIQFSHSCCSNSIWYRNAWFRGSWADGEDLLGHPLGGHGREWRAFSNGSFGSGRVAVNAAFYLRRRGTENTLAPAWLGRSTGVRADLEWAFSPANRLRLASEGEWGAADWRTYRVSASGKMTF